MIKPSLCFRAARAFRPREGASLPAVSLPPLLLLSLTACSGKIGTLPATGAPHEDAGIVGAIADASTADRTVEEPEASLPDGPDAGPAGDTAAPPVEAAPSNECTNRVVCDDFESTPVGGPPSPMLWPPMKPGDCSSNVGIITVDDSQAHSGTHSVKVVGGPAYCDHVFFVNTSAFPAVGQDVYARYFVRFAGASGAMAPNAFAIGQMAHETFMRMADSTANGQHLRLGGWNEILAWNRESDGATLPLDVATGSPSVQMESVVPMTDTWTCVELHVSESKGTIDTWVDGNEVTDLVEDGTQGSQATQTWQNPMWRPMFTDFELGWESYDNETATLWFDDVIIDKQRIGCSL
jgi:hypothetical protein